MRPIERRRGICRTVYLVGPWAIKTPRLHVPAGLDRRGDLDRSTGRWRTWSLTRGILANQSEADWSGVVGTASVLRSWLGGIVNVYPRCDPWPEDAEDPDFDAIGEPWMPKDRKRANVGLLDGEPVWLDYDGSWNGCPHERAVVDLSKPDGPVMHDADSPCDCGRVDRTDDHAFAPGCAEWDDDLHGE